MPKRLMAFITHDQPSSRACTASVDQSNDTFQKETRRFVNAFSDCAAWSTGRSLFRLTPFRFAHNMLRPEVQNLIIEMHETGIQPLTILQVLEKRGTFLTSAQVSVICKPQRMRKFSGRRRELCEWVESVGEIIMS
jgi:hypothetical protein